MHQRVNKRMYHMGGVSHEIGCIELMLVRTQASIYAKRDAARLGAGKLWPPRTGALLSVANPCDDN